jgi:hypothetical protein
VGQAARRLNPVTWPLQGGKNKLVFSSATRENLRMSLTVSTRHRLILWAVLLLPFLYVLMCPPLYHLGYRMANYRYPPWDYRIRQGANHVLDACAKPYWLLAENAPMELEMPLLGYNTWWRDWWSERDKAWRRFERRMSTPARP